jgi:hypothetical protein
MEAAPTLHLAGTERADFTEQTAKQEASTDSRMRMSASTLTYLDCHRFGVVAITLVFTFVCALLYADKRIENIA